MTALRGRRRIVAAASAALVGVAGAGGVCRFTTLDCHLCTVLPGGCAGPGAHLPAGFGDEVVAKVVYPTTFAFLPGGRILLGEKGGLVRIVERGRLRATPFLDLRRRVNTHSLRGLVTIEPHPRFAENGFVYVLYVREDGVAPAAEPETMRLSRFTVAGDRLAPDSERVLVGRDGRRGSCDDLPRGSDCIPADGEHVGGDIEFSADGTIFVSTGDGARTRDRDALRAQDIDSLAGKLLRITPAGRGVPGNPFWNGDPDAARSKVWAYGLRNPFRFTLHPTAGVPLVGDVGWNVAEELNLAVRGANLGWPCYEGEGRVPTYSSDAVCRALYRRGHHAIRRAELAYATTAVPQRASITAGIFHPRSSAAGQLSGAYVFGDWARNELVTVRVDRAGRLVPSSLRTFATDAAGPVQLALGPDRALYYLAGNRGELRRIDYPGR